MRADRLILAPRSPREIPQLQLRVRYRTQWLELSVRDDVLHIASEPEGEGVAIVEVAGRRHEIEPGSEHTIGIRS